MKYGMIGTLKAKDGKGDELVSILLEASKLVSASKGIHLYAVCKDTLHADKISIFEVWDSKEDHDNSLKLQAVKELISKAMPLIEGKPEGAVLNVIGGKGIDELG